jgi:thioredoxin 1
MLSITNESDFNVANGLYVIKFWATWCQPCKTFTPTVDKLDSEFEGITFLSVDADQVPAIVKQFKIRSLPTLLIVSDGEEVDRVVGLQLIDPVRAKLREVQNKLGLSAVVSKPADDISAAI